ncbi:hypothetical protein ACQ4PT_004403 [Festuca glaucescens]
MYKLGGRGGGRGGGGGSGTKRPPAPHGRGRGASSSMGGAAPPPRGRAAAAASAPAAQAEGREESFTLESNGPPAFAALIKLTPDLIDEIRRAEEAGSGAPHHVQQLQPQLRGGDPLCWTPTNPSVKIQAKSMTAAAVEGNTRRNWNQKKEHFKKNQVLILSDLFFLITLFFLCAVVPTKSISKVKLSNNSITKGSISTSPAPSPEQRGSSIPSFAPGSDANNEVIVPFDSKKEESSKVEKAKPNRISQGLNRRASSVSASVDDNATDLRRLLISVLSENPRGMNLKALEKAVADGVPNASKKIEGCKLPSTPGGMCSNLNWRTIDENIEEAAPSLQIDDPDIFEKIEIGGSPVSAAGDKKVNDSDGKAASSENLPIEEAIQFTKQDGSRRKSTSKDGTNHVPTRTSEKGAKAILKRGSDNENATTKPESAKKAKVDIAYSGAIGSSSEHRQNLPPDKYVNEMLSKETGNVGLDTHTVLQLQDSIPSMKGRPPASGNVQKINQSPNVSIQTMHSDGTQEKIGKASSKKVDQMQKPSNSMDGNLGKGYVHVDDHYINFNDSDDSAARKRGVRENVNHDVVMSLPECIETNGEPSILQRNSVDKSPPAKKVLQREQSELELGELREGSLENDIERTTRQFERNSSSKSLDGKRTNVDNSHPSMNNRKIAVSAFHDQKRSSPQEFTGGNINQEGMPRKTPGYDFDNSRYQDYVQEYNEKYEVYSYLNSQLKKTQSEFLKIQEDFDAAKERDKDQYYNIVERIRDMYDDSGHDYQAKNSRLRRCLLKRIMGGSPESCECFLKAFATVSERLSPSIYSEDVGNLGIMLAFVEELLWAGTFSSRLLSVTESWGS